MDLRANIQQSLIQITPLFEGVTNNTIICKNLNTLILECELSGLNDLATISTFLFGTIEVKGFLGAVSKNILPVDGYSNGMKASGVDRIQFIKNGKYYIVFDVTSYDKVQIVKTSLFSDGVVITAKASLTSLPYSDFVTKKDKIAFTELVNVNNMPIVSEYIKLTVEVKGINTPTDEFISLRLKGVDATDSVINTSTLIAESYPDNTSPSSVSGGVIFFANGVYTLIFRTKTFKFLQIHQLGKAGTPTFSALVEALYQNNVKTDAELKNINSQLKTLSPSTIKDRLVSEVMLPLGLGVKRAVIPTYGKKYISLSFNGTRSATYDAISITGYDRATKDYSIKMRSYSKAKNSIFKDGEFPPYYQGSDLLKDELIIPVSGLDSIWVQVLGVDIDLSSYTVSYLDDFRVPDNIEIHFRYTESTNAWNYYNPTGKDLCDFFGLSESEAKWLRIEYSYKKGYTSGLNISPTFKDKWENSANLENRPRFYNIYGESILFADNNLPEDYKYNYAKIIADSDGIFFVELKGKSLSTVGIDLVGYGTHVPANPFTLSVKLSVAKQEQFYTPATTTETRTAKVEVNDFKSYFFANQSRAKRGHCFHGGGFIWVSSDCARYYKVPINGTTFPGLQAGNNYPTLLMMPCSWSEANSWNDKWRLCVIINGQVYHNFPSSYVNPLATADKEKGIIVFEESNVWDFPVRQSGTAEIRTDITNRRLPSKLTEAEIAALPDNRKYIYKYFPVLPDSIYNLDGTYKYGNDNAAPYKELWYDNEGLITFPRYYNFKGANKHSQFTGLSYPFPGSKMTMTGNYFTTTADRAVCMGTSDGGANWYVKFDYASLQNPDPLYHITPLHGNDIWTSNLEETYVANSLTVQKRTYTVPTNEIKEPATQFIYSIALNVTAITNANGGAGNETAVVTANAHGLKSRDVVCFKTAGGYTGNFRALANNTASETKGGNGTFFIVEVVDDNNFKIREYIHSPDHNITARHIHQTNAVKDGFIISAGEEYPDGWIIYLQQKEKDQPVGINAGIHMPAYRLNSSPKGLYRPAGFIMLDDDATNPTCLFASDESDIPRGEVVIPGRTKLFKRNSSGIYRGKLSDIDDMAKWECVLPTDEMVLTLAQHGRYIFGAGMSSSFYVSDDGGDTWDTIKFSKRPLFMGGNDNGSIYTNLAKITFK